MARRAPDHLIEKMNRVVEAVGSEIDEFSLRASRQVLDRVEWVGGSPEKSSAGQA